MQCFGSLTTFVDHEILYSINFDRLKNDELSK